MQTSTSASWPLFHRLKAAETDKDGTTRRLAQGQGQHLTPLGPLGHKRRGSMASRTDKTTCHELGPGRKDSIEVASNLDGRFGGTHWKVGDRSHRSKERMGHHCRGCLRSSQHRRGIWKADGTTCKPGDVVQVAIATTNDERVVLGCNFRAEGHQCQGTLENKMSHMGKELSKRPVLASGTANNSKHQTFKICHS